ncbi:putative nitronate monooxygenase [Mycena sanguinolenta]|uniref:Putative nitronate monooxygenase n=1 Tax=Mycena sanguinolenta TaxID=230812 RepID=A0A8H7DGF6_9AGAR|nr:putative nitronate monooxygenase [Mycena sanguinolenta]
MAAISTPITALFGIRHPIFLAGMDSAAGPELAAAVTNAGGMGVIGGYGFTPKALREQIRALKADLNDKNAPFGVDLLLPQSDYTKGQLPELIDVIIEEKTALFVSAIGVPPRDVVDKLHKVGIPVMNMVGHPKHVKKALDAGVDLICAQAAEGGGHTGNIPASILIPACVDAVKGHTSPLTKKPVYVVGAGAVYDGRGLAANLMWGAQAVWVGTRFLASVEASAPKTHKDHVVSAGFEDVVTTLIYSGRPMRVKRTPYVEDWDAEIKELTSKGVLPHWHELEKYPEKAVEGSRWPLGSVAALINEVLPAKVIVDNMVEEAVRMLSQGGSLVKPAKL